MEKRINRRYKGKKRKWALGIFVVLLAIIASFATVQYVSFSNAVKKMNTDENGEAMKPVEKQVMTEPFSVLLLGIDERDNDTGRTDTMIVLTVNPEQGTVKMLSIPRDSRVEIVGNNTVEKINHAYARGGVAMSIATVEKLLDIPIDYYVAVNMEGFMSVIDTIGGIEVDNDMEMTRGDYHYPKGMITLSGDEALIFSRIRYEDPRGDFGRQIRQRQLIEALMKESKNPQILFELKEIFNVLGDNVRMNFTMTEIRSLPSLYKKMNASVDQIQFEEGTGERIDGLWYYIMNEEELARVQLALQVHLGLATVPSAEEVLGETE